MRRLPSLNKDNSKNNNHTLYRPGDMNKFLMSFDVRKSVLNASQDEFPFSATVQWLRIFFQSQETPLSNGESYGCLTINASLTAQ
jgi:hypothetical protein